MPKSSNVPPDSVALKGRKSLPNRFSLVNSYDFVISGNCTNCKPNMANCDSSKLMPLITVSGETQWELERQLRLSLVHGPASCGWHIVHSPHINSPCWELTSLHIDIAAHWGAGFDEGKAAKHVPAAGIMLQERHLELQNRGVGQSGVETDNRQQGKQEINGVCRVEKQGLSLWEIQPVD